MRVSTPVSYKAPYKVLITGGREIGGVSSFAEGLREGFEKLGVPAEVIPPAKILSHWRDLRDEQVLKILSTTAVFAAPFAKRAICVAHGFPRADMQGWVKLAAIFASFKLAEKSAQLVTVSEYAATHLRAIFGLRIDAVIHNPLSPIFLEPFDDDAERSYITFVGRLHPSKRIHLLLPVISEIVNETPGLKACILGDGPMRRQLEASVKNNPRIEFKGAVPLELVRYWLRRTKVFVSGCETEALGICYLEALSQGCVVAMPACGGGLEIAVDHIGTEVELLPISLEQKAVKSSLDRSLQNVTGQIKLENCSAQAVAATYLKCCKDYLGN